jgi:hypothetical protein
MGPLYRLLGNLLKQTNSNCLANFFRQAGDEAGIFARMDRAKTITASTESVASGLRLARCPRVKLWPASPALFAYAAALASSAPSKGRATRTSNLAAVLRTLMPPAKAALIRSANLSSWIRTRPAGSLDFKSDADFHEYGSCPVHSRLLFPLVAAVLPPRQTGPVCLSNISIVEIRVRLKQGFLTVGDAALKSFY